jgi:hypothetical protein
VRYALDRTLPPQNGYLTDSKLIASAASVVELAFGSDAYFAFAKAEAGYGAGALLASSNNVRFELLGRSFRVTDAAALPTGTTETPPEAGSVPAPGWRPAAPGPTIIVNGSPPPTPVTDTTTPRPGPGGHPISDAGLASREGCACSAGTGGETAVVRGSRSRHS